MDLIIWRHAHAIAADHGGSDDLLRALSDKGYAQAKHVAKFLSGILPKDYELRCSPALRARQTAAVLKAPEVAPELLGSVPMHLAWLASKGWPESAHVLIAVGHNPMLEKLIAHLCGLNQAQCALSKGALWWLKSVMADQHWQARIHAVLTPHIL